MPNMSYCMFENTYNDLRQCRDALSDKEISELSESEQKYARLLLKLCADLAQDYSDDD